MLIGPMKINGGSIKSLVGCSFDKWIGYGSFIQTLNGTNLFGLRIALMEVHLYLTSHNHIVT